MDAAKSNILARCCDIAIGLLLISAAILKAANPQQTLSLIDYSSTSIRFIAIQTEIIVGSWLILGMARRTAWTMAMILFVVMAMASLWLGLQGQSDCGCFGSVQASPWLTFALDITCIGLLIFTRPETFHWRGMILPVGCLGVLAMAGIGLSAWVESLNGRRTLARLQGHDVLLDTKQIDIGAGQPDEIKTIEIKLYNLSNREIKIVSGKASCSCVVTEGLPMVVAAHGEAIIPMKVTYLTDPGLFKREYTLFLDQANRSQVHGELIGVIVPRSANGP